MRYSDRFWQKGGVRMDKLELLNIISELISNNSNVEADDDEAMLTGVEDVMLNVGKDDGDVTILFTDGTTNTITVA